MRTRKSRAPFRKRSRKVVFRKSKKSLHSKRKSRKTLGRKRLRVSKRFVRKVQAAENKYTPWRKIITENGMNVVENVSSAGGTTQMVSLDTGMARVSGGFMNGGFDDLSYAFNDQIGSPTTPKSNYLHFDYITTRAYMRNNTTIGVRYDIYYIKPKNDYSYSDQFAYALQQLYSIASFNKWMKPWDVPVWADNFSFKKHSSGILYPAAMKCVSYKNSRFTNRTYNTQTLIKDQISIKYHRGLIIFFSGLPAHSTSDPSFSVPTSLAQAGSYIPAEQTNVVAPYSTVTDTAFKVDIEIIHEMKYRQVILPAKQNSYSGYYNLGLIGPSNLPLANVEIQPAVNETNAAIQS
nr:MAG: capsid protein [Cressdnaviricota sp.]